MRDTTLNYLTENTGARTTLGLDALPDGEAFYRHRIRLHTTLELSPEEVHEIGLRDVARLRTDPRFTVSTEEQYLEAVALAAKRMDGMLPRLFSLLPRAPYGIRSPRRGRAWPTRSAC